MGSNLLTPLAGTRDYVYEHLQPNQEEYKNVKKDWQEARMERYLKYGTYSLIKIRSNS